MYYCCRGPATRRFNRLRGPASLLMYDLPDSETRRSNRPTPSFTLGCVSFVLLDALVNQLMSTLNNARFPCPCPIMRKVGHSPPDNRPADKSPPRTKPPPDIRPLYSWDALIVLFSVLCIL